MLAVWQNPPLCLKRYLPEGDHLVSPSGLRLGTTWTSPPFILRVLVRGQLHICIVDTRQCNQHSSGSPTYFGTTHQILHRTLTSTRNDEGGREGARPQTTLTLQGYRFASSVHILLTHCDQVTFPRIESLAMYLTPQ